MGKNWIIINYSLGFIIFLTLKTLFRIGYAAAKQLVSDGASIMISSRKKNNVEIALEQLQKEYGVKKVKGLVCHVSKKEDRNNLIQEVNINYIIFH